MRPRIAAVLLATSLAATAARGFAAPAAHSQPAHAEQQHAEAAHGEHDENAPPPPINWWHGLFGVKEGREPDSFFRAPEEPPPYLASLINFGVLVFILVRYGKKPLAEALAKRKETLTREIGDAEKMRRAAEQRLQEYEARLEKIGEELARVHREFREQGERDKERIVREARERRERLRQDTALILEQEAKQMRKELLAEIINEATRLATELLSRRLTLGDHDRLAETFLQQLKARTSRPSGSAVPASPAMAKGGSS